MGKEKSVAGDSDCVDANLNQSESEMGALANDQLVFDLQNCLRELALLPELANRVLPEIVSYLNLGRVKGEHVFYHNADCASIEWECIFNPTTRAAARLANSVKSRD
jgi:hypothetical protein